MIIVSVNPLSITARQLMQVQDTLAHVDYELVFNRHIPKDQIVAFDDRCVYFGPAQ